MDSSCCCRSCQVGCPALAKSTASCEGSSHLDVSSDHLRNGIANSDAVYYLLPPCHPICASIHPAKLLAVSKSCKKVPASCTGNGPQHHGWHQQCIRCILSVDRFAEVDAVER